VLHQSDFGRSQVLEDGVVGVVEQGHFFLEVFQVGHSVGDAFAHALHELEEVGDIFVAGTDSRLFQLEPHFSVLLHDPFQSVNHLVQFPLPLHLEISILHYYNLIIIDPSVYRWYESTDRFGFGGLDVGRLEGCGWSGSDSGYSLYGRLVCNWYCIDLD